MEQFVEFIGNHYMLGAAWALLFLMLVMSWLSSATSSVKMVTSHDLTMLVNRSNGQVVDTVINNTNNRQVKMFKDGKVMWSRRAPDDEIDYFGYGSYEITDSTLTENLEYGSVAMLKVIDTMRVFNFELILGDNTFTQIDYGPEGDRIYSENYIRIEY